ncbi:MAG TPA: NifB/NifX family molybdenum-iron cluster-binding protein, partial [Clostridia bacterium]|nr:NifB/NifX family molybdenum-iron cluster-binding protein [Clostridia bacterium]
LNELGVNVLICGGISQELQATLERRGIQVLPQICGEVEAVIAAYRADGLKSPEFLLPDCYGAWWAAADRKPRCKHRKISCRLHRTRLLKNDSETNSLHNAKANLPQRRKLR